MSDLWDNLDKWAWKDAYNWNTDVLMIRRPVTEAILMTRRSVIDLLMRDIRYWWTLSDPDGNPDELTNTDNFPVLNYSIDRCSVKL